MPVTNPSTREKVELNIQLYFLVISDNAESTSVVKSSVKKIPRENISYKSEHTLHQFGIDHNSATINIVNY